MNLGSAPSWLWFIIALILILVLLLLLGFRVNIS